MRDVAFSPDGNASADGQPRRDGTRLGCQDRNAGHARAEARQWVFHAEFSPDGDARGHRQS